MLFGITDFGRPPDADVPGANPALGSAFRAPLMLVADEPNQWKIDQG